MEDCSAVEMAATPSCGSLSAVRLQPDGKRVGAMPGVRQRDSVRDQPFAMVYSGKGGSFPVVR